MPEAEEATDYGVSDASVLAKTGRGWEEWFRILDLAGAPAMSHKEIAAWLHQEKGVSAWWCQAVTVGYEKARGRRVTHQRSDGYSGSISRTFDAPVEALYDAWAEDRRGEWLGAQPMTITTATRPKSLRIRWEADDSRVAVGFYPKGAARSQLSIEHSRLSSVEEGARMQAFWAEALGRLKEILSSPAQNPDRD